MTTQTAPQTAQQTAREAKSAAAEVKASAADTAKEAEGALKRGAHAVQEQISEVTEKLEERVNQGVHSVGDYLKDADIQGMGEDFTKLIRKHPVLSVAIGIGLGMLLGGAARR